MIPKRRIYVSTPMDKHLSKEQLSIKHAIYGLIEEQDLEPQEFLTCGLPKDKSWSYEESGKLMSRCDGALILALVRSKLELVQEGMLWLPSEYNHLEGAYALAYDLPILVVADERLPNRGIVRRGDSLIINQIPTGGDITWLETSDFMSQFESWVEKIHARPRVFLGYCSEAKSTADALTLYIEHTLDVQVRNYSLDFIYGGTILEEIEKSARDCSCGIFLFTNDDQYKGNQPFQAAPRDNVVFEAGFFMHAKGKERTLIIREDGAKMPADVGGNIYLPLKNRHDISPIESKLMKFLQDRL